MTYIEAIFVILFVLKYYSLIDTGWGWIAAWGVGTVLVAIGNALNKEAK